MEIVEEGRNHPEIAPKPNLKKSWTRGKMIESVSCQIVCLLKSCLVYPPQKKPSEQSRSEFVSLVDKTLAQCRQLKRKFELTYTCYPVKHESNINNWIRYALTCNVEEVKLTLGNEEAADFSADQNFFIGSCFTDLRLSGCILNPTAAISWKNLKSLCIHNVELDEDLIENILSGSPVLETLVLDDCYGFYLINITSKSLKKLVYSAYMNPQDEYDNLIDYLIDICAPNISSLTIIGDLYLWRLFLINVSSLVEANLDYTNDETLPKEVEEERFKLLLDILQHVKEVKIGVSCFKVVSRLKAKGFVFPSNVKFVENG